MNAKKMFLAVVVGFVVMMVLGLLFHLVIMGDFFKEKMGGEPMPQYVILSYLILAVLMAYIYPHGYKGGSFVKEGFRFGLLMGLMIRLPLQVLMVGYGKADWSLVIVEAIWHMIEQGIGGIAIAYMYGRGASPSTT